MKIFYVKSDFSSFSEKTGIMGDFASVLWNGDISLKRNAKGAISVEIERFGPDMPSAYEHTRKLIITDNIKVDLEKSDLITPECIQIIKKKVIQGDWLNFDKDFFQKYDSLHNIIKNAKNNDEAAKKMPTLWCINPVEPLIFSKKSTDIFDIQFNQYADFYYGSGDRLGFFVSEKAKIFFETLSLPLSYTEII